MHDVAALCCSSVLQHCVAALQQAVRFAAGGALCSRQCSRRCAVRFACLAFMRYCICALLGCERRRWKTAAVMRKRSFEDSWQSSTKPKGSGDPRVELAGRNRRNVKSSSSAALASSLVFVLVAQQQKVLFKCTSNLCMPAVYLIHQAEIPHEHAANSLSPSAPCA